MLDLPEALTSDKWHGRNALVQGDVFTSSTVVSAEPGPVFQPQEALCQKDYEWLLSHMRWMLLTFRASNHTAREGALPGGGLGLHPKKD